MVAIATIPDARPSIPSIRLMEFMIKTIHTIVIKCENNPKLIAKKLKKVKRAIDNPESETKNEIIICTISLYLALIFFISSKNPIINDKNRAMIYIFILKVMFN